MIEYSIFLDDTGKAPVVATFDHSTVEVNFFNERVDFLNAAEWDDRSLFLRNHTFNHWMSNYWNTQLHVTSQKWWAFLALHVFAPDYNTATRCEKSAQMIDQTYLIDLANSSPGNVKSVIPAKNTLAEKDLFDKGFFPHLKITTWPYSLNQSQSSDFYFMPVNADKNVEFCKISGEAQKLCDSLNKKG